MSDTSYHKILKQYWNYSEFRDGQLDVIKSIHSGRDTLAVLPTGAGKSICYQVPGLMMDGIAIVISPLIALMKDQIQGLTKRGIKAAGVMTGQTTKQQDIILDNAAYGELKFLFISPERLQSRLFRHRLMKYKVSMLVVDEAHCISEWGHDFRPEYRMIHEVMGQVDKVPYLALTATATAKVQDDIKQSLGMKDPLTFLHSPIRHNISYQVHESENKPLLIRQLLKSNSSGCAIIYVNSRKLTTQLQRYLSKHNIEASAFHGGMMMKDRNRIIKEWESGEVKVMISTKAFGMGIDKSDVRIVIHYNIPESLEAYVQEAGRAGRDGAMSEAVMIANESDTLKISKRLDDVFPSVDFIKKVYTYLGVYYKVAAGETNHEDIVYQHQDFCEKYKIPKFKTINALKLLHGSGLIKLSESLKNPSTLYLDEYNIKRLIREERTSLSTKNFIRIILRTYEGILFASTTIEEELIAKRADISKEKVVKGLTWLHRNDYGKYIPSHEGSLIGFINYRYKESEIKINESIYRGMNQRYRNSIDSILKYVETRHCRQKIIAEYFDAEHLSDCGICDNCTMKINHDTGHVKEQVANYIKLNINDIDDIVSCFKNQDRKEVLRVLTLMESEGPYSIKANKIYPAS